MDKLATISAKPLDAITPSEDNLAQLRSLFPDAFADGQLDVTALLELLGRRVGESAERYGLTWHGKRAARQAALTPSVGTLRPVESESVDWAETQNLFIEGDNLEALKLLQKAFYARVKVIYIDPPYNTGNDLIYPDNYRDGIANYKLLTGQVDAAGNAVSSSTETTGRLHTAWLNMMYPRLKLARNLLRSDGVLFMSIDEREVGNARLLLAEIFGEENAICEFIWHAKRGGGSDKGGVVSEHEYVLCFARDATREPLGYLDVEPEALDRVDARGPYRRGRELNKWGANSLRSDRPTLYFPIPGPDGEDVYPIRNDGKEGRWRRGRTQMMAVVQRGDVEFSRRDDGTYTVYEKIRDTDPRAKPHRTLLPNVGQTADGTKAIKALFDGEKVFDFTKPPGLIKALIALAAPPEPGPDGETDFIVMDFFAGSGTTAQAVLELNLENETDNRFILVQLPEPLSSSGPSKSPAVQLCESLSLPANIAELTKERVRRAGSALRSASPNWIGDAGFRVLKLDSSNLREWDSETDDLEATLLANLDHVKDDRSGQDLLYEVLLRLGVDPAARVEDLKVEGGLIFVVPAGGVVAWLDGDLSGIDPSVAAADLIGAANSLSDPSNAIFVLRDSAFADDVSKTNLMAALDQASFSNVRTI